jgi:hypothetical protein
MRLIIRLLVLAIYPAAAATAQERPARWTGRIDLAIGGPDETREPYMFDIVGGLVIDRAGRIIVASPKDNSVRVFSATGQHLFSFGRAGGGPGDLSWPCCLAIDDAGRLWVKEAGNRRYSIFEVNASGARHLYSVRAPGGMGGEADRIHWDSRGAVLHVTTESYGGNPMRTVRHHSDSTGTVTKRDTLGDPPVDSATRVSITRKISGGMSVTWMVVPFAPRFLRAEGPNGQLVEANSSTYAIAWLDPDLRLIRTLRSAGEPPRVTAAENAAARDSIAEFAKRMSASVDMNGVTIPARKPAIVSLGFDLDGRLWVERSVPAGRPREADVYDARGRLIARATWPADVTLHYHAIRGMSGAAIRVDADTDVPSLVRLGFSAGGI